MFYFVCVRYAGYLDIRTNSFTCIVWMLTFIYIGNQFLCNRQMSWSSVRGRCWAFHIFTLTFHFMSLMSASCFVLLQCSNLMCITVSILTLIDILDCSLIKSSDHINLISETDLICSLGTSSINNYIWVVYLEVNMNQEITFLIKSLEAFV